MSSVSQAVFSVTSTPTLWGSGDIILFKYTSYCIYKYIACDIYILVKVYVIILLHTRLFQVTANIYILHSLLTPILTFKSLFTSLAAKAAE